MAILHFQVKSESDANYTQHLVRFRYKTIILTKTLLIRPMTAYIKDGGQASASSHFMKMNIQCMGTAILRGRWF